MGKKDKKGPIEWFMLQGSAWFDRTLHISLNHEGMLALTKDGFNAVWSVDNGGLTYILLGILHSAAARCVCFR